MRKYPPPLILWVLIVCLVCVSPVSVSAGVGDNIAGASLELLVGQPETSDEPATLFGWFRKVWSQLSKLDVMSTKIDSMSDKLDSMKLDVGISASQTYLTMLNDYQTNGTSSSVYNDKSQWDALCRSSVMHCSQKFSGEALDYYITNNISLEQFFKDMNYTDATIYTVDDIVANYSTIKNNALCMYSLVNSLCVLKAMYKDTTGVKSQFWTYSNIDYFANASKRFTHTVIRGSSNVDHNFGETVFVVGVYYSNIDSKSSVCTFTSYLYKPYQSYIYYPTYDVYYIPVSKLQ